MIFLPPKFWEVKETKNKGKGIFAKKEIKKGVVIGDYIGKLIHPKDVDLEKMEAYLMYYSDEACIYPDLKSPGVHLLNHSCSPNSFLYTYKSHTLVFTLRKILKEEELTISYQLPPISEFEKICTHQCRCESKSCTKTMHLTEEQYQKWRNFQDTQEIGTKKQKISYGKKLSLLPSYPEMICFPEGAMVY